MPYDREDKQLAEQLDYERERSDWEKQRRARVDRAIERLEAEVAAHEGDDELVCPACNRPYALHGIGCPTLSAEAPRTIEIANLTDERVTYRVEALDPEAPHGKDATTGLPLSEPVRLAEPEAEARFGDRLRRTVDHASDPEERRITLDIADAIDRDAAELQDALDAARDRAADRLVTLRRGVEEAVEGARYSATAGHPQRWKDVLDAEPFMEALGAIFGERVEERPVKPEIGQGVLAWVDGSWERADYNGPERGPYAWDFDTWGLHDEEVEHWRLLPAPPVAPIPPEHEPAHDRRERESARNEDRSGRVEGVDR